MVIDLELCYCGLWVLYKIKLGVLGCVWECVEVCGKDVGVIVIEKGWNFYVVGNGGMMFKYV